MTWATMAASGSGKLVLFLEIWGIPYVFATGVFTPHASDTWYSGGNYEGVYPWLNWEKQRISIEETANFIEGTLEVGTAEVMITDVGGGMTGLIKSWRSRTHTRLTTSLVSGHTTSMVVDSTTGFASTNGIVWTGAEAIKYATKDATHFYTLTRGYYNTQDLEHDVDADRQPIPLLPSVLDGPEVIAGRRANIWAAEVDTSGTVSQAECIFRGFVGPDIEAGEGRWRLRLDHITKMLSRKVCTRLPKTSLRPGYFISGGDLSSIALEEQSGSTITTASADVPGGYEASDVALRAAVRTAISTAQTGASMNRSITIYPPGENRSRTALYFAADTTYTSRITIRKGDPLWMMGFNPGIYTIPISSDPIFVEAQDDLPLFAYQVPRTYDATTDGEVRVEDATGLTADLWATLGKYGYQKVKSVTAASGTVTFYIGTLDPIDDVDCLVIKDADDLVLQHVFPFFVSDTVKSAFQKLLGLYSGQDEPQSWCVTGITSDDIDWDEFDDAIAGAPYNLQRFHDAIKKPTPLSEVICDRLGLLGIAPRITSNGKIGFSKLRTPVSTIADDVEVDDEIWEKLHAAEVITQAEGIPLLNQLRISHSFHYGHEQWAPETSISFDDGINGLGKTRYRTYPCRGLHISDNPALLMFTTELELLHAVAVNAIGAHFGVFGRVAPIIEVPCTWPSRQLLVGDIVKVTHPCIVDIAAGTVGTSSRVGIVVGRRLAVTENTVDRLIVQLPPEMNAGRIAPCAWATSYDSGTKTLTFSSTTVFAQTGNSDLDEFDPDMDVGFTEYNEESPSTWSDTIASMTSNTVTLNTDLWGGSFPDDGVLMHWKSYDSCDSSQKAWLFFSDTAYTLGSASDEAYQWAL